jgi:hypothetical protein
MRSRYDLAQNSTTQSDEGTYYKDIFTIPIQKFQYRESYLENILGKRDIERIDLMMNEKYGITEFDDLVMWINNIGFIYEQEVESQIKLPTLPDLENFYYDYRV